MEWYFLTKLIRISCLVVTVYCFMTFTLRHLKDEDSSIVQYRRFHDKKEDIYPSISICFYGRGIYHPGKLNKTYGVGDATEYTKFLKGDLWDDRMVGINYDDVTIDLQDRIESIFVLGMQMKVLYGWAKIDDNTDDTVKDFRSASNFSKGFPFRTTYRLAEGKCFTLDLSGEKMPHIQGQLINSVGIIFKNILIPDVSIQYLISYPGQILRGFLIDSEVTWNLKITSGYVKKKLFLIDIIDVFRNRNTGHKPCDENWKEADDKILYDIIKMVDCKPPHWIFSTDYPICNSKEKMKNATVEISPFKHASPSFLEHFEEPYDGIQSATLNILVEPRKNFSSLTSNDGLDSANVLFHFKNERYKEIKYFEAYDKWSLMADVGAVIGLFLGFAIWQIPDFIEFLNMKLRAWVEGIIHTHIVSLEHLPKLFLSPGQ